MTSPTIFLFVSIFIVQTPTHKVPELNTQVQRPELFVTNRGEIWRIDKSGRRKLCVNTTSVLDVDYHTQKNILFWIDAKRSEIHSQSFNDTSVNITIVFKQNRYWEPVALAVDSAADLIYVADRSGMKVDIFELNENYHSTVLGSHLTQPVDIKLDSQQRLLFILDGRRILRATTDGLMLSIIVPNQVRALLGITIDPIQKKLHWFNHADSQMKGSSYMGTNFTSIVPNKTSVFSKFSVYDGTIYLATDFIEYKSILLDEKQGLRQPNIHESQPVPIIRVFHPQARNSTPHSCRYNNGDCQHICLPMKSNSKNMSHHCACNMGWQLSEDSKNCTRVKKFLLYAKPGIIKSHLIETHSESLSEPYTPVQVGKVTDFDYDPRNHFLYYVVTHPLKNDVIYRTHLDDEEPQALSSDRLGDFRSLAFDAITSNLYITDTSGGLIRVLNTKTGSKMITILKNTEQPEDVAVHSSKALIFFLQTKEELTYLSRANSDGSNLTVFTNNTMRKHCGFALDFGEDNIYWVQWNSNLIQYSDFSLNQIRNISSNLTQRVYSIFIEQNWIYVVTSKSEGIWRFDKKTGDNMELIVPDFTNRITRVKTFDSEVKKIDDNHPCALNNGGCEDICFGLLASNQSWTKICVLAPKRGS